MKVSASQPVVFGYTSPRKIKGSASSTQINEEIKEVSAAIQASIQQNNTNKTAYVAGGIGLLVIAALAYQNYTLSQENAGLAAALGKLGSSSPDCTYSYDPKIHENFSQTSLAQVFQLDVSQGSPWCLDILTYGNSDLVTPEEKGDHVQSVFENTDRIVPHLSQSFKEPIIRKGRVDYFTDNPADDPERRDNILGMLIEHNCINTVEKIVQANLLSQFDLDTLLTAKRQATRALSHYTKQLLQSIAAKSPNNPLAWGFGEALSQTDSFDQYDGSQITVNVRLADHFPEYVFGPNQHLQAANVQRILIDTPEYKTWFEAYLVNLLERKDSEGNQINIQSQSQKDRVLTFIKQGLADNRPFTVALIGTNEVATLINNEGLTKDVQDVIEGKKTAVARLI